jgi:hypothetical protein
MTERDGVDGGDGVAVVGERNGVAIDLTEGEGLAAVAALWRKTGRELRARFGGSSMEPALPAGSEVLLRCGEAGAPGDVIAFLAGGRLLVHRVVARAGDGSWTLTRGDARTMPDVPIRDASAIVGRVAGLCRGAAIEGVPAARDSPARRGVVRLCAALVAASPRVGSVVLRSIHGGLRLARSAAILARRSRPRVG